MKFKSIAALVTAAVLANAPSFAATVYAESSTISVAPVYDLFNENDVNGRVIINLPDGSSANVEITMESNEWPSEQYYECALSSADGNSFSLDIEGRDNTEDDYRIYKLSFSVRNDELDIVSDVYTDEEITVPDGGDNPNSWVNYRYNVNIELLECEEPYNVVRTEKTENGEKVIETDITFYVYYLAGDVNEDGKVTATDAALVLSEYAAAATDLPLTFTERQKIEADVTKDGKITATDAAKILSYYAVSQTTGNPSWD